MKKYRLARRAMGVSYLMYCGGIFFEFLSDASESDLLLQKFIVLAVGSIQAFMFTYAMVTLIDIRSLSTHSVKNFALIISTPILVSFLVYANCSELVSTIVFYLYAALYFVQLLLCVRLFMHHHSLYMKLINDYFSNDEYDLLHWVTKSFKSALLVGICALVYALFTTSIVSLLFDVIFLLYYVYFGVRFINYAFSFHYIEEAMDVPDTPYESPVSEVAVPSSTTVASPELSRIYNNVRRVVEGQELYKLQNLTVGDVASLLDENYRTVSKAIRNCCGCNFSNFINGYRVKDAIRLVSENYLDDNTIESLAQSTGFSSRMSLLRAYRKETGVSLIDYVAIKKNGSE
ncbi:MAG: AraC family transcriptional regulator [Bacteroidaceae bacterium]|nr:AraC family transcriptional regulator [Bacteroidaceae bacterium]